MSAEEIRQPAAAEASDKQDSDEQAGQAQDGLPLAAEQAKDLQAANSQADLEPLSGEQSYQQSAVNSARDRELIEQQIANEFNDVEFKTCSRYLDSNEAEIIGKIKQDLAEPVSKLGSIANWHLRSRDEAKADKESHNFNKFIKDLKVKGYKLEKFSQQEKLKSLIKDYFLINLGTLIMTIGVYFFKFPNNFAMGGVTGFSVVFSKLLPVISPGSVTIFLNLFFLLLGYLFLGKSFGFRTTYATLLMNSLIFVFERLVPIDKPLTSEPLLELSFAVILPSVGAALIFYANASSGGTDVLAMLLKHYSNINIGKALVYSDFLITFSSFLVFDVQTVLLSILGMLARGSMVDTVMNGLTLSKYFIIVTGKPEIVGRYITVIMHRGATRMKGEGFFTGQERSVFICAVGRNQAPLMAKQIRKLDPHAFILLTNTNEIWGNGFKFSFN